MAAQSERRAAGAHLMLLAAIGAVAAWSVPLTGSLAGWGRSLALVACGAAAILLLAHQVWRRPRDALMEIAACVDGDGPPAELARRAARHAELRAKARPPPTQDEALAALDCSPAPRFAVDDPRWLSHLDAEGYAVVADVASKQDLVRAEDLLWEFLEETTTWRRGSPDTWTDEAIGAISSTNKGIVSGAGIGQSAFLWHVRTLPLVRQAFAAIWKCSELLVSFDGANLFRPWNHGFQKTSCGWWHVDQGRGKQGRHAVQGFVSLTPANARTGGLTVLPGSHLRFGEVTQDMQNPETDYCTVQGYAPVLQELPHRLVSCQPGDLVLWDSRTVHANAPAPLEPTGPADQLLRAVAYVCMTPKKWASHEALQVRRAAFEHGFGTTHWPHLPHLGNDPGPSAILATAPAEVRALVG